MKVQARAVSRNRLFDVLRIVFATLVLLAHAPELTDGNRSRELFNRLTHSGMTFGELAVDGFFLLSGFLIVQSWQLDPELLNFLRKRLLRIVPGFVVATILSILVVGLLAPSVPHFFSQFRIASGTQNGLSRPGVFPGLPEPFINGSLWTIPYEFRCYLLVALLGLCGLLRRRALLLSLTIAFLLANIPFIGSHLGWHHLQGIVGEPSRVFRLTFAFLVGCCFYIFRERIPFRKSWMIGAAVLLTILIFVPYLTELALVLLGGYLMFYFGERPFPLPARVKNFPDISYGVYLYGWPVENLWIFFHHGSPWVTVAVSVPICFILGWLSWHFVERPMLRLKRKATSPLPAP